MYENMTAEEIIRGCRLRELEARTEYLKVLDYLLEFIVKEYIEDTDDYKNVFNPNLDINTLLEIEVVLKNLLDKHGLSLMQYQRRWIKGDLAKIRKMIKAKMPKKVRK